MNKVVWMLVLVLAPLGLWGCGNKDKSAARPPNACGAGVPSQACMQVPNYNNNPNGQGNYQLILRSGPQGYGYYNNNFFVPDYSNFQTNCPPGTQPFLSAPSPTNNMTSDMACLQTSMLIRSGQPIYQQNYQWSNGQTGMGPGQLCSNQQPEVCGTAICQIIPTSPDSVGYCRANQ